MADLVTLLRNLAKVEYSGRFPVASTTTSAGDAGGNNLIDALNLLYSSGKANAYDYAWVRIDEQETGGPAPGSVSRVIANGLAIATGTLSVSPAFTSQVKNGTNFSLHYDFHPDQAKDAINRALRGAWGLSYTPLTQLTDGHMENSGTGSWPTTNATAAKVSTSLLGSQALTVTASAANGYAYQTVDAFESRSMYISALARPGTATAKLVAYDLTNSKEIETADSEEIGWVELAFPFTIPANCEQLQVRLQTVENGGVTRWDGVCLWDSGQQQQFTPWPTWVEPSNILGLYYQPRGGTADGDNAYLVTDTVLRRWPYNWQIDYEDPRARYPFALAIDSMGAYRYYIQAYRRFDELSAESDTTVADSDYIIARARGLLWAEKAREAARNGDRALAQDYRGSSRELLRLADDLGRKLGYASRLPIYQPHPVGRTEMTID